MQKRIGWLWPVGFFGLAVAAVAQTTSSQTAGSQFDGTYAFVSSTKLTETYIGNGARMFQCPDWTVGPLTIERGQARFSTASGHLHFEGTVGSQGELAMQSVSVTRYAHPDERLLRGRIDATGTVRARVTNPLCDHDIGWRK
jgi:hypothetical protein